MSARLKPVKSRSLSDDVFESLREAIFSGKFKPGDPLRELHLAKELAVSQHTVRDALVKLERYGLVVRIPNKETIVTRHSSQEVRERMEIRATLEEQAFLKAAAHLTAADYEILQRKLKALSAARARNEYFAAAQADLDFHRYIWRRSGNATLYEMLDQLATPLFAFISVLRSVSGEKMKVAENSHEELLDALKSKKAAAIRQALNGHFTGSYDIFLNSGAGSLEELLTRRAR